MRDATLEYRLSIYHARASDSGLYTCNTPNNKSHSIHIIVADVRLVDDYTQSDQINVLLMPGVLSSSCPLASRPPPTRHVWAHVSGSRVPMA